MARERRDDPLARGPPHHFQPPASDPASDPERNRRSQASPFTLHNLPDFAQPARPATYHLSYPNPSQQGFRGPDNDPGPNQVLPPGGIFPPSFSHQIFHAHDNAPANSVLSPYFDVGPTAHPVATTSHVQSRPVQHSAETRSISYGPEPLPPWNNGPNPGLLPKIQEKSSSQASVSLSVASPVQRSSLSTPSHLISSSLRRTTARGIQLICPRDSLPHQFHSIFRYPVFNEVQSKCFPVVYESDDNLVVAAPTGSGKTIIMELAICRLAAHRSDQNYKVVYQAPTKALCSERARDWAMKFGPLGLTVGELTGDTSAFELSRVGAASIIVTTPEKWDSVTRKWQDHRRFLEAVEVFLIDEVHILKDPRGSTLEAVVSRMKTIGVNVRFVALSATLPNSEDIAKWLGRSPTSPGLPAKRFVFGDEARPVQLQKRVYGFDFGGNHFTFDKMLDQRLPSILDQHARGKPILVFCFTRKSCEATAQKLAHHWSASPHRARLWPAPSKSVPVISPILQKTVGQGVTFHHAGLDLQDRVSVEQAFLKGEISVICCTSTLAIGMNLPCHTVILKGTAGFLDGRLCDYSDIEVMQMLGRAGRPQFEDSALGIILTTKNKQARFEKMASGGEVLESTLHLNLIGHLNSEIVLGTIKDLQTAKAWLAGTFLCVRLRRNPAHYDLITSPSDAQDIDAKLHEICERDIDMLQKAGLVTLGESFSTNAYGRAMSTYMVRFETMKQMLSMPTALNMEKLLINLSQATEFVKDMRLKANERQPFRELNRSPFILYPIQDDVTETWQKIFLLVQMRLGAVEIPNDLKFGLLRRQIMLEKDSVIEYMHRLVRCFIECSGASGDGVNVRIGLELARGLAAGSWEGRPSQLLQAPSIGVAAMRKLVTHNVRTVAQLAALAPANMERILSRHPPFGRKMNEALALFPRLTLDAQIVDVDARGGPPQNARCVMVKAILGYANEQGQLNWDSKYPPRLTFMAETSAGKLVYFWRGTMKQLAKENSPSLTFTVTLADSRETVACHFSCEEVVGTIVSRVLESHAMQLVRKDEERRHHEQVGRHSHPTQHWKPDIDQVEQALGEDFLDSLDDEDLLQSDTSPQSMHMEDRSEADRAPVRLSKGRWRCNHACAGGMPTKKGNPCQHQCCREGITHPPRSQQPGINPKKRGRDEREHSRPRPIGAENTEKRVKTRGAENTEKRVKTRGIDVGDSRGHVIDLTSMDDDAAGDSLPVGTPWAAYDMNSADTEPQFEPSLPNPAMISSGATADPSWMSEGFAIDMVVDTITPRGGSLRTLPSPPRSELFRVGARDEVLSMGIGRAFPSHDPRSGLADDVGSANDNLREVDDDFEMFASTAPLGAWTQQEKKSDEARKPSDGESDSGRHDFRLSQRHDRPSDARAQRGDETEGEWRGLSERAPGAGPSSESLADGHEQGRDGEIQGGYADDPAWLSEFPQGFSDLFQGPFTFV